MGDLGGSGTGGSGRRAPVGRAGVKAPGGELDARLDELCETFHREMRFVSSTTQRIGHRSMREVASHGVGAVPWIFRKLESGDFSEWDSVLLEILGDGPVIPEEMRGRRAQIAAAWLDWGRRNGHAPEPSAVSHGKCDMCGSPVSAASGPPRHCPDCQEYAVDCVKPG